MNKGRGGFARLPTVPLAVSPYRRVSLFRNTSMPDEGEGGPEAEPEQVTRRSWFWAFDALGRAKAGGARLPLNIPDTVLFTENEAVGWLFTSKEGFVMRRHTKRLRLDTIIDSVLSSASQQSAAANARPSHSYAVAVRNGGESSSDVKAQLLTHSEVLTKVQGGALTGGLLALQVAVPSRAGGGTRYRCEATSAKDGIGLRFLVTKLVYLGRPADTDAPHPRSTEGAALEVGSAFEMKCSMQTLISDLSRHTANIVKHLSEISRSRVVRLQADFMLSAARADEAPLLVAIPLINTAPLPQVPHKSSLSSNAPATNAESMPKLPTDPETISMLINTAPRETPAASDLQARRTSGSMAMLASAQDESSPGRRASIAGGAFGLASKGDRQSLFDDANDRLQVSTVSKHKRELSEEMLKAIAKGVVSDPTKARVLERTRLENDGRSPPSFGPRPTPWMRLHPAKPFGFSPGSGNVHTARKVALCEGDFCEFNDSRADRLSRESSSPARGSPHHRRQYDEEASPKTTGKRGNAECTIPYRSVLQARAERAVASSRPDAGVVDGAALREACLAGLRPGRSHPFGPQRPSAAAFYSEVQVCQNCLRTYSRLDKQRAHTESAYDREPGRRPRSAAALTHSVSSAAVGPSHTFRTEALRRAATEKAGLHGGTQPGTEFANDERSQQALPQALSEGELGGRAASNLRPQTVLQSLNRSIGTSSTLQDGDYDLLQGDFGRKHVRRLLAELQRHNGAHSRPSSAVPTNALRRSTSSVVSLSLGGAWAPRSPYATSKVVGAYDLLADNPGSSAASLYSLGDVAPGELAVAFGAEPTMSLAEARAAKLKSRRVRPQSAHALLQPGSTKKTPDVAEGASRVVLVRPSARAARPATAQGVLTMTVGASRRSRSPDLDARVEEKALLEAEAASAPDDSRFVSLIAGPAADFVSAQPPPQLAKRSPHAAHTSRVAQLKTSRTWQKVEAASSHTLGSAPPQKLESEASAVHRSGEGQDDPAMIQQHGSGTEMRMNHQIARLNSVYGVAEPSPTQKDVSMPRGAVDKAGPTKAVPKSSEAAQAKLEKAADDEVSAMLAREEKVLLERLADVRAKKKAENEKRGRSLWNLAQQRMRKARGKPQRVPPSRIEVRVRLQAHLGADDNVSVRVGVNATSEPVA